MGGGNTYSINDPAYDRASLADYGYSYQSMSLFSQTPPSDQRKLIISAHSPVELLVLIRVEEELATTHP